MARHKDREAFLLVLKEARRRQLDEKWLSSSSRPLRGYYGKYVAVKSRRIVAASSTMRGLYRKLDQLDTGMVLIAKVEKPTLLVYVELY